MMSNRKHIAKTGANAGQWVRCNAEQTCRNGGFHVSDGTLNAVQEWRSQRWNRPVYQNELGETDILGFASLDEKTQRKFVSKTMFDSVSLKSAKMEKPERIQYSSETINAISMLDNKMDEALSDYNNGWTYLSRSRKDSFIKQSQVEEDKGNVPAGYTKWMEECYADAVKSPGRQGWWKRYITGMVGDRLENTVKQGKPMPTTAELKEWADSMLSKVETLDAQPLQGGQRRRESTKLAKEIKTSARGNQTLGQKKVKELIGVINGFFDSVNRKVAIQDPNGGLTETTSVSDKNVISSDDNVKMIRNVIREDDRLKMLRNAIRKDNGGRLPYGVGKMNLNEIEQEAKKRNLNI